MIDAMLENEAGEAPTAADLVRWADGLGGPWASGALDFPVVGDGDGAVWIQWHPSGSGSLPTNLVIGADFVTDMYQLGWWEDGIRCCIEKNLCHILPPETPLPWPDGTQTCADRTVCLADDGSGNIFEFCVER